MQEPEPEITHSKKNERKGFFFLSTYLFTCLSYNVAQCFILASDVLIHFYCMEWLIFNIDNDQYQGSAICLLFMSLTYHGRT